MKFNFWATVCKTVRALCYRTVVCPLCLSVERLRYMMVHGRGSNPHRCTTRKRGNYVIMTSLMTS